MSDWQILNRMVNNPGLIRGFFRRLTSDIVNEVQNEIVRNERLYGIDRLDLRVHPGLRQAFNYMATERDVAPMGMQMSEGYPLLPTAMPVRLIHSVRMTACLEEPYAEDGIIVTAQSFLECESVRFGCRVDLAYDIVIPGDGRAEYWRIPAEERSRHLYRNILRMRADADRDDRFGVVRDVNGQFIPRHNAEREDIENAIFNIRGIDGRENVLPNMSAHEYVERGAHSRRTSIYPGATRPTVAYPPCEPFTRPLQSRPRVQGDVLGAASIWES